MSKSLTSVLAILFVSSIYTIQAKADDNGIAAVIHTLRAETGRVCQDGHFHIGKSPRAYDSREKAMSAAIRHWSDFTVAEYGTDWGHFSLAGNQTTDCDKESAQLWVCKVKGRPCRKGLSTASR